MPGAKALRWEPICSQEKGGQWGWNRVSGEDGRWKWGCQGPGKVWPCKWLEGIAFCYEWNGSQTRHMSWLQISKVALLRTTGKRGLSRRHVAGFQVIRRASDPVAAGKAENPVSWSFTGGTTQLQQPIYKLCQFGDSLKIGKEKEKLNHGRFYLKSDFRSIFQVISFIKWINMWTQKALNASEWQWITLKHWPKEDSLAHQ